MSTPRRATEEQWRQIELVADIGSADCAAILELRDRLAALETSTNASTNAALEGDSLVERVARAIDKAPYDEDRHQWDEARAAIQAVAAWLRENDAECQMGGDAAATADLLEQEAERG